MPNHLQKLYASLQEQLETDLRIGQTALTHPVSKGDSSEADWLKVLVDHLPHRYQASRAFVIDSLGRKSEQIDVVIYDRQYTPILYNKNEQRLIPAESVYAIFEVKPVLNTQNILYASKKAVSVRQLHRTSTEIAYAAGKYEPRPLFPIIGGILTYKSVWKPELGKTFINTLKQLDNSSRIDLGCVVTAGTFEMKYDSGRAEVIISKPETSLASFLFLLLAKLQSLATVPAIDYQAYRKWLA
jgi:uncharacterized protein DUF6602